MASTYTYMIYGPHGTPAVRADEDHMARLLCQRLQDRGKVAAALRTLEAAGEVDLGEGMLVKRDRP